MQLENNLQGEFVKWTDKKNKWTKKSKPRNCILYFLIVSGPPPDKSHPCMTICIFFSTLIYQITSVPPDNLQPMVCRVTGNKSWSKGKKPPQGWTCLFKAMCGSSLAFPLVRSTQCTYLTISVTEPETCALKVSNQSPCEDDPRSHFTLFLCSFHTLRYIWGTWPASQRTLTTSGQMTLKCPWQNYTHN